LGRQSRESAGEIKNKEVFYYLNAAITWPQSGGTIHREHVAMDQVKGTVGSLESSDD
jgi:hypothetical protein